MATTTEEARTMCDCFLVNHYYRLKPGTTPEDFEKYDTKLWCDAKRKILEGAAHRCLEVGEPHREKGAINLRLDGINGDFWSWPPALFDDLGTSTPIAPSTTTKELTTMHEVTKDSVLVTAERFLRDGGCTGLSCRCCPFDATGKLRSLGYHGMNPCEGVSSTSISDEGHALLDDIVAWARSDDVVVAARPRRLTVGDRVVITGTDASGGGKHGVIIKDDHKEIPYCVRLDDGTAYWKHDSHVRPERDDERPMRADDALRYVVQATPTRPFDSSHLGVSTPASRARWTLRSL